MIFSLTHFPKYKHTGSVQTFSAPIATTYRLEVWGAQGGNAKRNALSYIALGGKGGYSSGIKDLPDKVNLYVCVGGAGGSGMTEFQSNNGGYNGGGSAIGDKATAWGSGGGATHIATSNRGILMNYNSYKSEIIIVAGGGGGGGIYTGGPNIGGHGGGISGSDGSGVAPGKGGTQTVGGTGANQNNQNGGILTSGFGKGGNYTNPVFGSGGGGGYYGGGEGYTNGSAGGGGSGYIGGVSNATTIAGNQTIPSPTGGTETGHSGNGYCKITWHPAL